MTPTLILSLAPSTRPAAERPPRAAASAEFATPSDAPTDAAFFKKSLRSTDSDIDPSLGGRIEEALTQKQGPDLRSVIRFKTSLLAIAGRVKAHSAELEPGQHDEAGKRQWAHGHRAPATRRTGKRSATR